MGYGAIKYPRWRYAYFQTTKLRDTATGKEGTIMKKILAMLMAVAMVLTVFAGCGAETASSTGSAASAETVASAGTAAAGEATSFKWNGQKEVWSILPTTAAEGLIMINDAMGAKMEEQGFTYVKKDAQGDPSAQVSFVEDAIAAGNVGALMIAAMSVDMLKDVVQQAVDAGIAVAYLGAQPTDYTIAGCVYTAYEITGMYAVQAAEDWVAKRVAEGGNVPKNADGKYEVACDVYTDIADGVYRSNAIVGTVDSSDTLVRVSTTSSYKDGYNKANSNAQDVLSANPDCHIFIAYEPQLAMGMSDAIADYCEQNGLDMADYCVIPCYGEDNTFTEMYNAVSADHSANAIKGYATYGDPPIERDGETIIPPVQTGEHLADALLTACGLSEAWNDSLIGGYGGTYYDTITAVNVYGFEASWKMGQENPASQYKDAKYIGG